MRCVCWLPVAGCCLAWPQRRRFALLACCRWLLPRAVGIESLAVSFTAPPVAGVFGELPACLLPEATNVPEMPLLRELTISWRGWAKLFFDGMPALPALRTLWLSATLLEVDDSCEPPTLPQLDFGVFHGSLHGEPYTTAWVPPGTTHLRLMAVGIESLPRAVTALAPTLRRRAGTRALRVHRLVALCCCSCKPARLLHPALPRPHASHPHCSLSVDRNGPLASASLSRLAPLTRLEALVGAVAAGAGGWGRRLGQAACWDLWDLRGLGFSSATGAEQLARLLRAGPRGERAGALPSGGGCWAGVSRQRPGRSGRRAGRRAACRACSTCAAPFLGSAHAAGAHRGTHRSLPAARTRSRRSPACASCSCTSSSRATSSWRPRTGRRWRRCAASPSSPSPPTTCGSCRPRWRPCRSCGCVRARGISVGGGASRGRLARLLLRTRAPRLRLPWLPTLAAPADPPTPALIRPDNQCPAPVGPAHRGQPVSGAAARGGALLAQPA